MTPKIKYALLSTFIFICFSCQENKDQENQGQEKVEAGEEKTWGKVEIPNMPEVQLTPEAQTEASEWLAFVTAQSEIMDYRKNGVEYAAENAGASLQIMQELQKTIPEKFKTTPVEARISVLVTMAHILNQESGHRQPDKGKIAEIAKKIPTAFDHLKIQLNEVFIDEGFETRDVR